VSAKAPVAPPEMGWQLNESWWRVLLQVEDLESWISLGTGLLVDAASTLVEKEVLPVAAVSFP